METVQKPKNIPEYKKWLKSVHNVSITRQYQIYYESTADKMLKIFEESSYWQDLTYDLERLDQQFLMDTSYNLLN